MAFDKITLQNEVLNDPLTRGYSGMTNQQVADDMNTAYRNVSVESVEGQDIVAALVPTDVTALTVVQQRNLWGVIGAGAVRPDDQDVKDFFGNLFGGTQTATNLLALATAPMTRAAELGLPPIRSGWVEWVRL